MNEPPQSSPPENPATATGPQLSKPATTMVPIHAPVVFQRTGRFRRFCSWLGWIGFVLCLLIIFSMALAYHDYFNSAEGVQERFHSLSRTARNKIAIIEVAGTIADGESSFVKKQINRVLDDDQVKGVVLRVNSPGGTISGSDYLLHHLVELRSKKQIPLVVSMGSLAASGGYYVAMAVGDQERSIFAEPTSTTGSIGVVIPHYNIYGLLRILQIKDDSIVSHERKKLLSMTQEPNPEHREILQQYVNQANDRFKEIVRSGRPVFAEHPDKLDELATGEIFSAQQALESGLVDQIGFIEVAIDRVIELAGLDKANTRVVRYKGRATVLEALGFAESRSSQGHIDVSELLTPQAYYLWTSLPGISSGT